MRTLNLGILAHIDAGKTSLTERLLYDAGVIAEIGSVDAGSTQTDSLDLERRRGITIKSAVASFTIGDLAVNLIDTPGHPDFIAEVERVLSVLDGAVLVVSAVEGVQAQTRILMRALRRLRIPSLVFVNKADRRGADPDRVLRDLTTRLGLATVPMTTAVDAGTRAAGVREAGADPTTVLAEGNDTVLEAYVEGTRLGLDILHDELVRQTRDALVHPVYTGSAITGAGVPELTTGLRELLPAAEDKPDNPVSATVFKVERGPAGEKIAYVRMFDGTIATRDRVGFGADREGKVTAISVFDRGPATRRTEISAGQIGKLWGLTDIRIGDVIGEPRPGAGEHHFAPPTLETVVVPAHQRDKGRLRTALGQLAEQDPLIDVRQDDVRQEIFVSLYGEVQKEVIQATLAEEFGVEVTFRETTTICVERPAGTGAAYELIGTDPNPFLATVGLRVEPAPIGSGVEFRLGVELGSMPFAFFRAVEETVRTTLHQGINGWEVTDCVVTMTHSGYYARQSHSHGTFDKSMSSTAGDFRNLTPLVLMDALRQAGTLVCEPLQRFRLELPSDLFGAVLPVLSRLRAVPQTGTASVIEGEIPSAMVHELELQLPGLTRGEGMLETEFSRYESVRGDAPSRERTDDNPLDRKEYLLHVERRV